MSGTTDTSENITAEFSIAVKQGGSELIEFSLEWTTQFTEEDEDSKKYEDYIGEQRSLLINFAEAAMRQLAANNKVDQDEVQLVVD